MLHVLECFVITHLAASVLIDSIDAVSVWFHASCLSINAQRYSTKKAINTCLIMTYARSLTLIVAPDSLLHVVV